MLVFDYKNGQGKPDYEENIYEKVTFIYQIKIYYDGRPETSLGE